MLDNLPPALRHAVIGLAGAILAYATANYTNWGLNEALYPVVGALLTILVLWITPLSRQYGVGSGSTESFDPASTDDSVDGSLGE